jgi:hypothetical protein
MILLDLLPFFRVHIFLKVGVKFLDCEFTLRVSLTAFAYVTANEILCSASFLHSLDLSLLAVYVSGTVTISCKSVAV